MSTLHPSDQTESRAEEVAGNGHRAELGPPRITPPPALSIVVPTYHRPEQLLACLGALGRMDPVEGGFEVVVAVDGGRADAVLAERALGGGVPLVLVQAGGTGPAAARNAGAAAASGELIAFTDDDCEPDPGWANAILRSHRERPDAMIGGLTVNALETNRYARAAQAIGEAAIAHHNGGPAGPTFFPSNNFAVPAARFLELGGFDPAVRRPGGEDRDFCERWTERGWPLAADPEALVRHANDLDLLGFWRQHSSYGAGAFHHRRARAARVGDRRLQPSLTSGLAGSAVREAVRERDFGRLALLVVWQVATLAGFAGAALRSRFRRATR